MPGLAARQTAQLASASDPAASSFCMYQRAQATHLLTHQGPESRCHRPLEPCARQKTGGPPTSSSHACRRAPVREGTNQAGPLGRRSRYAVCIAASPLIHAGGRPQLLSSPARLLPTATRFRPARPDTRPWRRPCAAQMQSPCVRPTTN